jgi:hypothetical protein
MMEIPLRRMPTPALNARKLRMSIASIALLLAFFLSPTAQAHAITGSIGSEGILVLSGMKPFEPNAGNVLLDELDMLGMIDLGLDPARNNTVDQTVVEVLNAFATDQVNFDTEMELIATSLRAPLAGPSATGNAIAAAVNNSVPDASNTALFLLATVGGLFLIKRQCPRLKPVRK